MATLLDPSQIKDQFVNRTGDQLVTGQKKMLSNLIVQSGLVVSGLVTGDPPFAFESIPSTYHISLFSGHESGAVDGRSAWLTEIGGLSHRTVGGDSASGFISIVGSGGIIVAPGSIGSFSNTILIRPDLSGSDITYSSAQPAKNLAISGQGYIWNSGNTGTFFPLNSTIRWSDQVSGLIQTGQGRLVNLKRDDLASIDFGHSGDSTTSILQINAVQTGAVSTYIDHVLSFTGESVSQGAFRFLMQTGVRTTECSTSDKAEQKAMEITYTGVNIYKPLVISGVGDFKASGIVFRDASMDGTVWWFGVSGHAVKLVQL